MLKDYFHGKLSPNEAASEFVKSFDLEPMCNRSFQGHLEYLAAIAYDVSDPRGQTKVVKLLVAIRNLRCGMKKGWHERILISTVSFVNLLKPSRTTKIIIILFQAFCHPKLAMLIPQKSRSLV